jgi:hypothetical protein
MAERSPHGRERHADRSRLPDGNRRPALQTGTRFRDSNSVGVRLGRAPIHDDAACNDCDRKDQKRNLLHGSTPLRLHPDACIMGAPLAADCDARHSIWLSILSFSILSLTKAAWDR